MAKHDKGKSNSVEAKLLALRILEEAAYGIITEMVVYWLTK